MYVTLRKATAIKLKRDPYICVAGNIALQFHMLLYFKSPALKLITVARICKDSPLYLCASIIW